MKSRKEKKLSLGYSSMVLSTHEWRAAKEFRTFSMGLATRSFGLSFGFHLPMSLGIKRGNVTL